MYMNIVQKYRTVATKCNTVTVRYISDSNTALKHEINKTRQILAHTSQQYSHVYAQMLKEHTESITKSATNDQIKNIARELDDTTQKYHEAVTKYLKNRDDYNEAAQTRITNDANIKFGVVGVAFMCVFGSLALSLHPIFLVGCAIGGYTYRPVFRQSRKRIEITNDMEARLQISKQCKDEIEALQKHIEYQLEHLECKIK